MKRLSSFLLALVMVILCVPFTAQNVKAETVNNIVTEEEVIKKACEMLGAPYSQAAAANYADPNTTGANFKTAAQMKSQGTDCTGMIYWTLGSLGISMSWSGQDQYPVPYSGERWTAIANAGGATIKRNGKTGTIHATKSSGIVATDWWKYCEPGSVVSTAPNDWSNDHGAIYVGEFANVSALTNYLSSIGVTGVDSYIRDQGNGNTHWTIEENYGYGQCVITNPTRVSKGTAYYTDIVTWDIPTKPDLYSYFIKKTDTGTQALSGAVFGVYSDAGCTNKIKNITTGSNGIASILEQNNGGVDYYVKELTAPSGYQLSSTIVKMTKVYNSTDIPSSVATVKNVPYGNLKIVKTANDDNQLQMSFEIKADKEFPGSVKNGNYWYKTVQTNSNGQVVIEKLLDGTKITVTELKTGAQNIYYNTTVTNNVNITIEGLKTKTVNFTNERIKANFSIYKTDNQTKTPVANAVFKIVYDGAYTICGKSVADGATVTSTVMRGLNPSNGQVTTNANGEASIANLQVYDDNGNPINYKFIEVNAPLGYLVSDMTKRSSSGNVFSLENKAGQTLSVTDLDGFRRGVEEDYVLQQIAVAKKGEFLIDSSDEQAVVGKDEEAINYKAPVYEEKYLKDAIYDIYVMNDVTFCDNPKTDEIEVYYSGDDANKIEYRAGTVVDTIITNGESDKANWAKSIELPIGEYRVVERTAPNGYYNGLTNAEPIVLEDIRDDEGNSLTNGMIHYVNVDANFVNKRTQLKIELEKLIEENENFPNPDAYKEVAYGVYCEEDIFGYGGVKVFEKGDRVDVITLDKVLNSDEQVIGVMHNGDAQKDGEGDVIRHPDYIYVSVDDSDLPISNYTLKEIRTDKGLWMDPTVYKVSFADEITCTAEGVDENGNITDVQRFDESVDTHTIHVYKVDSNGNVRINPATGEPMQLENHVIRGSVEFYKKSLDGDEISGVKFGVWRAGEDADEWIDSKETSGTAPLYTVITDSNGYARIDDIPAGDYILREIQPAKVRLTEMIEVEQFYLNREAFPFTIEDKENQEVHTILIDLKNIINVYKEGYLVPGASDVPMIYLPKDKVKGDYTTSVNTFDANQIFAPMMLTCVSAIAIALIKGKRYKLMKAYFRK